MNPGDKYPSGTQVVRERSLSPEGADAARSYLYVVDEAFSAAQRYAGVRQAQTPVYASEDFSAGHQAAVGGYGYDQEAA